MVKCLVVSQERFVSMAAGRHKFVKLSDDRSGRQMIHCLISCWTAVRHAIHFFVNFNIFKWLYLAYYWVYSHQTWRFCKSRCALSDHVDHLVRLVPSPSRYEIRQYFGTTVHSAKTSALTSDTDSSP